MPHVLIRLKRPAFVTPELRAWITQLGPGRVVLSRGAPDGPGLSPLLLRITPQSETEDEIREEIDDLLTDLRLLGLRPTLSSAARVSFEQPELGGFERDGQAARAP